MEDRADIHRVLGADGADGAGERAAVSFAVGRKGIDHNEDRL